MALILSTFARFTTLTVFLVAIVVGFFQSTVLVAAFSGHNTMLTTRLRYVAERGLGRHPSSPLARSSTALSMNFFKGLLRSLSVDGGSFQLQIDYDSLPFPCPEIADMARQQHPASTDRFVTSPSQPHLYLGTFAGGCFW